MTASSSPTSATASHNHRTEPPSLATVVAALDSLYPPRLAEEWDKPGLAVGDLSASVSRVYFALDATREVIEDALAWNADLIVTHHPFLFSALPAVTSATDRGASIHRLITKSCAVFSAHTNADSAYRGVNEALAALLGLTDTRPILPDATTPELGMGRVGTLAQPVTLTEFAQRVAKVLPGAAQGIRVAGNKNAMVHTVAVLGGSGGSCLNDAADTGADVYLTSDLKHHDLLDFLEARRNSATTHPAAPLGETAGIVEKPYVIDTAHYSSESVWLPLAAADLADALAADRYTIATKVSDISTDPWTFHVAGH